MKPLRLLLVEPPFHRLYKDSYGLCKLPLGLGSLAATARTLDGVEVLVCNADFHPAPEPFDVRFLAGDGWQACRTVMATGEHPALDALERVAREFQPHVAGVCVRTPTLTQSLLAARRLRRGAPDALLLAGGPHPSIVGPALLRHPEFDALVLGEGEATLRELLHALASGREVRNVPGLVVRGREGIVSTPPRPLLDDLDALPFPGALPVEDIVDGADYPARAFGYVFASRGCPHACGYCSSRGVWGRRVRFRSPENVVAELELLAARGVRHVHFDDDTFGVTPPRLAALCRALEQARLGLSYSCETHVSLVDGASAAALSRAGFVTVQLGLESGDDAMLARVGKGFDTAQAERAAAHIRDAGMRLEAFFMVGFPDETKESLAATRRLMERLHCHKLIYSIFTPYPGTPLFERCRELGLIRPGQDPSQYNHQSPENAFCPRIPADRFRTLASEIEALVSERNNAARQAQVDANREMSSAMRLPMAKRSKR